MLQVREDSLQPAEGSSVGYVSELALRGDEFVSILDVEGMLDLDAG